MWTYSGDPTSSPKDKIRFELGDTVSVDPLLQDEEINFCITAESSYYGQLARACEAVAMRFQREASTKVGALSYDLATRAEQFSNRADMYRKRAVGSHVPYVGGMSKAEKEADHENPDKTGPYFRKDMERNRWLY
jgi:hypothetical protein